MYIKFAYCNNIYYIKNFVKFFKIKFVLININLTYNIDEL